MKTLDTTEYMKIRRYVMNLLLRSNGKMEKIPTIVELSEKFGVSRPTVSRAMKELTSQGFVIAKRGIGSFINPNKTDSLSNKLPIIGLMIGDGMNTHINKYFGGAVAALLKKTVFLPAVVHWVTTGTANKKQAVHDILNEQLDALIVFNGNDFTEDLRKAGLPVIVVGWQYHNGCCVAFDHNDFNQICAETLMKQGCRNIVFLHQAAHENNMFRTLVEESKKAGIKLNEKLFLNNTPTDLQEFRNILKYVPEIDAVIDPFNINNEALNLIIQERPELVEKCIIVCDADSEPFPADFPYIKFKFPFDDIADAAVELLREILKNKKMKPYTKTIKIQTLSNIKMKGETKTKYEI